MEVRSWLATATRGTKDRIRRGSGSMTPGSSTGTTTKSLNDNKPMQNSHRQTGSLFSHITGDINTDRLDRLWRMISSLLCFIAGLLPHGWTMVPTPRTVTIWIPTLTTKFTVRVTQRLRDANLEDPSLTFRVRIELSTPLLKVAAADEMWWVKIYSTVHPNNVLVIFFGRHLIALVDLLVQTPLPAFLPTPVTKSAGPCPWSESCPRLRTN